MSNLVLSRIGTFLVFVSVVSTFIMLLIFVVSFEQDVTLVSVVIHIFEAIAACCALSAHLCMCEVADEEALNAHYILLFSDLLYTYIRCVLFPCVS